MKRLFLAFFCFSFFNGNGQNIDFCHELKSIKDLMQSSHYQPKPVNNSLSKHVFKLFLDQIDSDKHFFTRAKAESAKEGLEILKTVELYKNDKSIAMATKKVFEFFIDEAENKIPVMEDFLVSKEDLDKTAAALEKTPQRKRTKEQIDGYNDLVNAFNKGVK